MSKVFVIPDVHLKPWMFDKAEELFSRSEYDKIVCLGDLVDDWDQEKNLGLYSETFDALERFINRHPNFLLCYGNHDVSYIWEARESGYSDYARRVVIEGLSKLEKCVSAGNIAYIHRIDNVLFSHAGLTEVLRYGINSKLEPLSENYKFYIDNLIQNTMFLFNVLDEYVVHANIFRKNI